MLVRHRRKGIGARTSDIGDVGGGGRNLILHLDANAPNALLDASDAVIEADATAIKTWKDISGNGRDFTQATSGHRPVSNIDVLKNMAVLFDGSDDAMHASEFYTYVDSTVFIVFKASNATGTETLFSDRGGNANEQLFIRISGDKLRSLAKDDGGATIGEVVPGSGTGVDSGVAGLVKLSGSAGTPTLSVSGNGAAFTDGTNGSYNNDTAFGGSQEAPTIGARNSAGTAAEADFFAGDILEIGIWPRVLTVAEMNKLLKIASQKYGLTVSTL